MKTYPNVKLISGVPDYILQSLTSYITSWDYQNKKYRNFNRVFGFHYGHEVKTDNFSEYEKIKSAVDWLIEKFYPRTVPIQIMFNCLTPDQKFPLHVDTLDFHLHSHRIHIPLSFTSCDYYHLLEDESTQLYHSTMSYGSAYEFNNIDPHCVENTSSQWRINFIIDLLPTYLSTTVSTKKLNHTQFERLKKIENHTRVKKKLNRWRLCFDELN
jgi:hypothetical protein